MPKPHGQSRTVYNRSAHQIRMTPVPTVGDGNVSRGTGAAQTAIEIFTFVDRDPHKNRGDPHDPHDPHHLMLFFLMPQQRSMVPVSSGTLFALERLILWLLWILRTLGLMILFSLLVGEEPSTLGERTYECLALVHEKVLSELVLSGKPLGTLGTFMWSQRLIMISFMFL